MLDPLPAMDKENMGKWISFMPAAWSETLRQETFEALSRAVMQAPGPACPLGKMARAPLYTAPDQVALMFYADETSREAVFERLQRAARTVRLELRKAGHLHPRSKWLAGWTFKTDAQTREELAQGKHVAQVAQMMELMDLLDGRRKPKF